MQSDHVVHFQDAARLSSIPSNRIHLVVTSPPYPMIEMWDALFSRQQPIAKALKTQDGPLAFELMHRRLDAVWRELYRVLTPGGIVCINIGDATRTLKDEFALFANHSRILSAMLALGFTNLPNILWRKQTNAPNKFMGSGMMPPGAYVTLEHEYVLIFRKGGKRVFTKAEDKANRRRSAFFWEERNQWFSDVWMDLKGTRQKTADRSLRARSGAFPFELAYRLISMFSVMGDTVLDPFLGTGTTCFAAGASGRNSIGVELDEAFAPSIEKVAGDVVDIARQRIDDRITAHMQFVAERETCGKPIKYVNSVYGFPVITRQETELVLPLPTAMKWTDANRFCIEYTLPDPADGKKTASPTPVKGKAKPSGQLSLFN